MTTVVLDQGCCPYCKTHLNMATSVAGESPDGPKKGDISLCSQCGSWVVFGENSQLEKPSEEMMKEISSLPEYDLITEAWRRVKGSLRH